MCCRCHLADECMACGKRLGQSHRWFCQIDGAFVLQEDCCDDHHPDEVRRRKSI